MVGWQAAVGAAVWVLLMPQAPEKPSLDQALAQAGRYVVEYADKMTLVIATEHYGQWMEIPDSLRPMKRMLVSEYALVRIGDDWEGFRDVYEVDSRPVGERQNRLQKLFLDSPEGALRQGRQIADESARYNMGSIRRNFNTPTMTLLFLHEKYRLRFKFKKAGEDRIDGVAVWKIKYEEVQKPSIIRTSAGKDMPVDGTFWIDPLDGRVLKSHMQMKTEAHLGSANTDTLGGIMTATRRNEWDRRVNSSASVTVTYRADSTLGILVPAEMLETYEGPWKSSVSSAEGTSKINCRATYSDFKRFDTANKLIVK